MTRGVVESFNPDKVSPSRVNSYLSCGVAFRRKYIEGEPPQLNGSAALFGQVIHGALEKWAVNRAGQDLVSLVAQSWLEITKGTPVRDFLGRYQSISIEVMKAEKAAAEAFEKKNKKPSQAPRMTKHFKESDAARKLGALLAEWLPRLNAESPWRFSERDPLPNLYDESLILGKRYARQWAGLPNALHTEFGFDCRYGIFILTGYIDAIEPVVDGDEVVGYAIVDYKTYRADPAPAKDWRQAVIYDLAVEDLITRGALNLDPFLPRYVVFDYVRLGKRKDYVIGKQDHSVLLDDLQMYRDGVDAGVFLPAQKNANPDFCDYEDCCLRSRGEGTGCRGGLYPDA